jgi:hypothetical protein
MSPLRLLWCGLCSAGRPRLVGPFRLVNGRGPAYWRVVCPSCGNTGYRARSSQGAVGNWNRAPRTGVVTGNRAFNGHP